MKAFSDFSLNFFCLLFGFFLGNLFPNLLVFSNVQWIENSSQKIPLGEGSGSISPNMPWSADILRIFGFGLGESGGAERSSPWVIPYPVFAPLDTSLVPVNQDTRINLLIQTLSGTIPGPSQVGILILAMSELINWTGKFIRTRIGGRGYPPPGPVQSSYDSHIRIFSFLNSIKIGLLFGIFVDAFKVGS